MLRIERVEAGYGTGTVLHGVSLDAPVGAVHAVVGHNGAGKTTLMKTVAGMVRARRGRILLDSRDLTGTPPHRRVHAGVALVPQGRRVFASLTVAEHLAISYRRRWGHLAQGWDRDRVLALLPQLARRLRHRGSQLSGGEQQMLAIARALLTQPRLLLMDEPTEGLAPSVTDQILRLIAELTTGELAIVLTASRPELVAGVAGRVTHLTVGRVDAAVPSATVPHARR